MGFQILNKLEKQLVLIHIVHTQFDNNSPKSSNVISNTSSLTQIGKFPTITQFGINISKFVFQGIFQILKFKNT